MQVKIFCTVKEIEADLLKGKTAVVIDTLRATSTIVTALHNGANAVLPKEEVNQVWEQANRSYCGSDLYLLGGERGGLRLEGFHLGNSPLEYTREIVQDKNILLSTTNGTKAIQRGLAADHLLIGSLLNSRATMERVAEFGLDLVLCCSGTQGNFSLEDFITAGAMVFDLYQMGLSIEGDDRIQAARLLYERSANDLVKVMSSSQNGTCLLQFGRLEDIDFCAQKDRYPIVCTCQNDNIYSMPIIRWLTHKK